MALLILCTPSILLSVEMLFVIPFPVKISEILPIPTTSYPANLIFSNKVGDGGSIEKSFLFVVLVKLPLNL